MAIYHIDAFAIGSTIISLSDTSYTEKRGFAEYTKDTEAGTTRRDVVRIGYLSELSVKFRTIGSVKATIDTAAKQSSLSLTIWDDDTSTSKVWTCFISDYTADLVRDTSSATYWDISVTFKDLEES